MSRSYAPPDKNLPPASNGNASTASGNSEAAASNFPAVTEDMPLPDPTQEPDWETLVPGERLPRTYREYVMQRFQGWQQEREEGRFDPTPRLAQQAGQQQRALVNQAQAQAMINVPIRQPSSRVHMDARGRIINERRRRRVPIQERPRRRFNVDQVLQEIRARYPPARDSMDDISPETSEERESDTADIAAFRAQLDRDRAASAGQLELVFEDSISSDGKTRILVPL
ncbi:hypothetical protein LTR37_005282 [Vermiconidia calcicola]|uniref:Uncharacterized protein n=1 Tax=Vermiconidia calcicola TaxID=1690605 RepID=A0ACC3NJR3_9PEZI|nr:hypothetical protein LTR37_005282 [Vermiconidia calcicola]